MKNTGKTVTMGFLALGAMAWSTAFGADGQTNAATMQPIVVQEKKPLHEETVVGPYSQPEWTTARRFPTTRIYLQHDPLEFGFEQWWRLQHFRDGTTEQRFQEELGIGLPGRLQLDLYETWKVLNSGDSGQDEVSIELRYAFADWGKLPGNPTIYLEWALGQDAANGWEVGKDAVNGLEAKLLLGDEWASGVHWGVNLVCEQAMGGERTTEYTVSGAIGKTLVDEKLGIGLEAKYSSESDQGGRSDPTHEVMAGPSLQWRPAPKWHIDVAPLAGLTHDAPRLEAWVVAGFEFGPGSEKKTVQAPISTMRN